MQIFLAAYAKQRPWTAYDCETITDRIYKHYLGAGLYLNPFQWRSPNGKLAFWLFYNEPFSQIHHQLLEWDSQTLIYLSGYAHQPLQILLQHTHPNHPLDPQISRAKLRDSPGLAARIVLDGTREIGWLDPPYSRVEGLFGTETPTHWWGSNRPLAAHLAALHTQGQTEPQYDLKHLWIFVNNDHFFDQGTPFQNVANLTAHQSLELSATGGIVTHPAPPTEIDALIAYGQNPDAAAIAPIPSHPAQSATPSPTSETALYDQLTDAFLASFTPLQQSAQPIKLALTGGKDSRLIAAALKALNLGDRLTGYTLGLPGHGDAVIAQTIADTLQFDYQPPQDPPLDRAIAPDSPTPHSPATIPLDAWQQAVRVIHYADGMISPHERGHFDLRDSRFFLLEGYAIDPSYTAFQPSPFNQVEDQFVVINGQGGELIRGGFGRWHRAQPPSVGHKKQHYFWELHRYAEIANPALIDHWQQQFQPLQTQFQPLTCESTDLGDLPWRAYLDRFFRDYCTGRWSQALRLWQGSNLTTFHPFFETHFLQQVARVPFGDRLNERILYEITRRLAPELLDIPYFNDSLYAPQLENSPAPLRSTSPQMKFKFMETFTPTMQQQWRDYCLGDLAPPDLAELINRDQLEALIASDRILQKPQDYWRLFWGLLLVSCLLSNQWRSPQSHTCIMQVPLP